MLEKELDKVIGRLLSRTVESGAPNCSRLNETLRVLPHVLLNIKSIAYEISRLKSLTGQGACRPPRLEYCGLTSKLCTAADLESSWASYWLKRLQIDFAYHRKSWELCFVLQSLYENLNVFEGKKGLGFACGTEKIPSCLASLGAIVTATDAPHDAPNVESWKRTGQHSSSGEQLFYPEIVPRNRFDEQVRFEFLDMNHIPSHYDSKFDFCWSVCAAEHLGSIDHGIRFIEKSLGVLVPGGIAVHTIEFNLEEGETIDNWTTVLFQRKHVDELGRRIARAGGVLFSPDYSEGDDFRDRYTDTPPYDRIPNTVHLKLDIDGFRCTCMGLILKKG